MRNLFFFVLTTLSVVADVTFSLHMGASAPETEVANSVRTAAALYNQYGSFNKHWNVYYNAGIPTAEANYDGYMGYGSQRTIRTVIHEGAHTMGMGTTSEYQRLVAGGLWGGVYGQRAASEIYNAELRGDGHAIWPGGMNYENEDGVAERVWSIRIQAAIRCDMGILAYSREAQNELVAPGETAEFRVESPAAASFRWHKNGAPLTDGGDFTGVTTAVLRIANAEGGDEGVYHCVAAGAGESLNSRPRRLFVRERQMVGRWDFDGDASDSSNSNNGTASGGPIYVTGKIGQAVDLDGVNDFIQLPAGAGLGEDITVAAWVNWDGGGSWQRIFDFGTGTHQTMFLTPSSGSGTLRLAFKDVFNGPGGEKQINAPALPIGQWAHLTAVLRGDYATLYVNGRAVGSVSGITFNPTDFLPTQNYIGKSQFPDPLFNGRVDDFRVYNYALTGGEVWSVWGQSANSPPVFTQAIITAPDAAAVERYSGHSLATFASDTDGGALTFAKVTGPAWLTVSANGAMSGTPDLLDGGMNSFVVRVTDAAGASADAELRIYVAAPAPIPVLASATAPATDNDDRYYLATGLDEAQTINGNGTNSGANDESTYVAEDRSSKGQTFTTGADPNGYAINSFTVQHVRWPTLAPNGTFYSVDTGDTFRIQFGRMAGTTKTPMKNALARYAGAPFAGGGTSGTGNFLTFIVAGLGLPRLAPNTTYYFEIAPETGAPHFELNSASAGNYAGGTAFRGGTGALAGTIGSSVTLLSGDFVFHVSLGAPMITAVARTDAPTPEPGDQYFLAGAINESATINGSGVNSGANDESTYVSSDRSSKAQTFTTGSNADGYRMRSFTVQHVQWPVFVNNGTFHDIQPGDSWEVQVGRMSGGIKSPLLTSTATYLGAPLTGAGTSGTGTYLTVDLSGANLPTLAANTMYYFELAPGAGAPFFELNSAREGAYTGGGAYRGNNSAGVGNIGSALSALAGDFIFHAQLMPLANDVRISAQIVGSFIEISWPAERAGWRLQTQANGFAPAEWSEVSGSDQSSSIRIPIDPAEGSVFFRLISP